MNKRYLILVLVMLGAFTYASAQMVDITFNVNMANEEVSPTGVYLAGGGPDCFGNPGDNPMTDDDEDGVWTITVSRPVGFACAYTFTNGNCPDYNCKENIVGQPCAVGEFSDRFLEAVTEDTVINTCFSQCTTDGSCGEVNETNVTFKVDVSEQTVGMGEVVYVFGSFNSWSIEGNPMEDEGNGIWSVTIPVAPAPIEYKFVIGSTEETLDPSEDSACTVTNFGFTNRSLTVGDEDIVLPAECFAACGTCDNVVQPTLFEVTFSVDMSQVEDEFTTPEVNGTFNTWCGNCNAMTDQGDGIWTTTITLEPGSYEYKFSADTWTIQEDLAGLTGCTIEIPGEFANRTLEVVDQNVDQGLVCWNSCEACVNSVTEINGKSFKIYPNPTSGDILTLEGSLNGNVEIYNTVGATVIVSQVIAGSNKHQINVSELPNGTYYMKQQYGEALGTFVVSK